MARSQVGIRGICEFVDRFDLCGVGFAGGWRPVSLWSLYGDVQCISHSCQAGGGEVRARSGGFGASGSGLGTCPKAINASSQPNPKASSPPEKTLNRSLI